METIIAFIAGMLLSAVWLSIFEKMLKKFVNSLNNETDNPWHDQGDTPENRTHVLAFKDGRYSVMFYRDAMYEDSANMYLTNCVDRWMYIPGNTLKEE